MIMMITDELYTECYHVFMETEGLIPTCTRDNLQIQLANQLRASRNLIGNDTDSDC